MSAPPSAPSSPVPNSASSMPPPPRPHSSSPAPVPVFAPKPMRIPSHYLPQRGVLPLPARTPSPASSLLAIGRRSRSGSIAEGAGGDGDQMVRLYSPSPSHDVLDDFLKLVRSQNPSGKPRATVSPLNLRSPQGNGHRKQWSGSSNDSGEKIPIPASPVSRALTRNPIIYNSQFGLVQEET